MANEDKGKVICPFCNGSAPVRRNSRGKLYFNCPIDGLIQPALPHFQSWMMDNATIYGPEGAPEVEAPIPAVVTRADAVREADDLPESVPLKKETPPPAPPVIKPPAAPVVEKKRAGIEAWLL